MPVEKHALAAAAASRTQRSSNLPDSFAASVANGPAASFGQQQLGLEQNLEAVADAEDQLAGIAELCSTSERW